VSWARLTELLGRQGVQEHGLVPQPTLLLIEIDLQLSESQ